MCCFNNLMITISLCVSLVYSQGVLVKLSEVPYWCEEKITLKCTITGADCCTAFTRVWNFNNTPIMSDGTVASTVAEGKYSEEISSSNNYFLLTIHSLDKNDFGKDYVCSYKSFVSSGLSLKSENLLCPECWDCVVQCLIYYFIGMVLGIVLQLIIYAIGFCCCKSHFYASCCHKSDSGGVYMKLYGKAYDIDKKKMLIISCVTAFLLTLGVYTFYLLVGLIPGGTGCLICYYNTEIALMCAGFGILVYFFLCYLTLKWRRNCNGTTGVEGENTGGDKTFSTRCYVVCVVLTLFLLPLLVLVPYMCCKANSRKKEDSKETRNSKPIEL